MNALEPFPQDDAGLRRLIRRWHGEALAAYLPMAAAAELASPTHGRRQPIDTAYDAGSSRPHRAAMRLLSLEMAIAFSRIASVSGSTDFEFWAAMDPRSAALLWRRYALAVTPVLLEAHADGLEALGDRRFVRDLVEIVSAYAIAGVPDREDSAVYLPPPLIPRGFAGDN